MKACDDRYADWQAMQQVIAAYNVVVSNRWKAYRKEKSAFAQLVLWLAGDRTDIMNDDGNPSQAPWVIRLRAAIRRVIAGEVPRYTLYRLAEARETEASMAHDTDVLPETDKDSVGDEARAPRSGAFETEPKYTAPAAEPVAEDEE